MTLQAERVTPPDGPFETLHPSGEVAQRGRYANGKYDGTLSRFASSVPGGEPLRSCCVPPGATELREEYKAGRLLRETFFDRHGRPLCADGTPWPAFPAGVPSSASYDEASKRYVERDGELFAPARLRYYGLDGIPVEEFEFANGRPALRRGFGRDGRCVEEWGLDQGRPHGAYRLSFDAATCPYADARIRVEEGHFEHVEGSGTVRLLDEHGELVRAVEHGAPLPNGTSAFVTAEEPSSAVALPELAASLFRERRPREACAVAARALARGGDVAAFRTLLAREVAELRPDVAARAAALAHDARDRTPSLLLDRLLAGAEPAVLLRTLASTISPESPAALDYAEASFLLAPDEGVTRATRGLLRVEHGDPEGALADARAIAPHSAKTAEILTEYARVLFSELRFEPAQDPVAKTADELQIGIDQPLEAILRTIGLYATRMKLVREALLRRLPERPAWLPPDTSALLPAGPIELRRYVARIADETDEGAEELSEVPVDETLEPSGRSVRALLTLARADWAALSWLCWSVGLDRVALPERIEPPAVFADAANRATVRCFWAQDRLKTEGLIARSRKLEPFTWQGLPIETLPRHLVEVAAAECLEIRAVFLWLLFAANESPFQADLRAL
jgi:hypothetical protein